jgi:hypothetical protein
MTKSVEPARLDPRLVRVLAAMCRQLLDKVDTAAPPQPSEGEAELRRPEHAQIGHPSRHTARRHQQHRQR